MNTDRQKIAIAEACGWTLQQAADVRTWWTVNPDGRCAYGDGPEMYCPLHVLPDYLNDLNAMHEAEKIMDIDEQIEYAKKLGVTDSIYGHTAILASATQRAEAFLRTLDLWESETVGSLTANVSDPSAEFLDAHGKKLCVAHANHLARRFHALMRPIEATPNDEDQRSAGKERGS